MDSANISQWVSLPRLPTNCNLLTRHSANAYAQFGAALGIPVTIAVPGNASHERMARMCAHGAELVITDPIEGYDFALRTAATQSLPD